MNTSSAPVAPGAHNDEAALRFFRAIGCIVHRMPPPLPLPDRGIIFQHLPELKIAFHIFFRLLPDRFPHIFHNISSSAADEKGGRSSIPASGSVCDLDSEPMAFSAFAGKVSRNQNFCRESC